jgi:hypothetical protein
LFMYPNGVRLGNLECTPRQCVGSKLALGMPLIIDGATDSKCALN